MISAPIPVLARLDLKACEQRLQMRWIDLALSILGPRERAALQTFVTQLRMQTFLAFRHSLCV